MQKVVVVILNFKIADYTIRAVESVLKSSYKNLEIVVVDNNSGDDLEEKLQKFPQVKFSQVGDNLGYAGGNNVGFDEALKLGADFVLILNPDAEVTKDTVTNLVEGMKANNADIANPKIYFSDSKKIWFAGKIFDKLNVLGSHTGVNQEDEGQFDVLTELDDITGCALMVKKEVLEKLKGFDRRYFMYYEDLDFATRAKEKGFKIMYIPQAVVYHANGKSAGLGSPIQDYFIIRNRMLYAKEHLPKRTQFALFREALRTSKIPARRLALKDFLMGKFGKGSFIK